MATCRCKECGGDVVWDTEAGSSICTECGTLEDASQSVLTSSQYDAQDTFVFDNSQATTLKSLRHSGRNLAGQEKHARHTRNTLAMHSYILGILTRLSHPGLLPRANTLFDNAMTTGKLRWGRKAKLTAGASIIIALRESGRSSFLDDIAHMIEETPLRLSRTFSSTVRLLRLDLVLADPASHLQAVSAHINALIDTSPGASLRVPLPASLIKVLRSLQIHFPNVIKTSTSLSTLIARTNALAHLSTPATACALFLLSLEAEQRTSLPNYSELAKALGARFNVSGGVVMERYKVIYDLVEQWIRDIPWLEAHEKKGKGRSKVAKRVVVARGLKDVVQFQEELWRKALAEAAKPVLTLELDEEELAEDEVMSQSDGSSARAGSEAGASAANSLKRSSQSPAPSAPATMKRRKTGQSKNVDHATDFLLHPSSAQSIPGAESALGYAPSTSHHPSGRHVQYHFPLLSHVLAGDSQTLSSSRPPTRLQMLAGLRGGSGEEQVADEELFEEGELEGLMRDEAEREVVRRALDWHDEEERQETAREVKKKGKRKAGESEQDDGTRRIDMEAYQRLMMGFQDEEAVDSELDLGTGPNDDTFQHDFGLWSADGEEGLEVSAWRPPTPERAAYDDSRYDH
ncbi:hypothetical protein PUNSTDRAFT_147062 [Punctularia strigosozonata HHB-11173 SS5]|uniref:TFIIB-type domain-containing protein n=1 Tax=Punctularia strigosozonata (strain HHB-11173) TaxID=741275 RepID=R7S2E1_PUNST|nr:uncharacterized protein PUNSTDRAFT_147062 [Punctularia strigosozonata HHB-11173 SS5]EIN03416.1 hypothetical protein PUNSTDRAFT_147062 [Punctularia strigosozonata HHB-11173 SS5]